MSFKYCKNIHTYINLKLDSIIRAQVKVVASILVVIALLMIIGIRKPHIQTVMKIKSGRESNTH